MGSAVQIWENSRAKREKDYGLENALAKYVRNRWTDKLVVNVSYEWDLSDSEAAKVVYANASKNTLNKLLHHKRGGFGLFLSLLEDVTSTKLKEYIEQQAREASNERRTWEAEQQRLEALATRLSGDRGVDRGAA